MKKDETKKIDELLKQIADTQGEGDSFHMFSQPSVDESKVDESLLQEMIDLDNLVHTKMTEWESRFSQEVCMHTSMKVGDIVSKTR